MIKIGVIGLGAMGKNHARVCSEIEHVELVGVADVNRETADSISNRFDTKCYYDYKDLISDIDAAIIATPTTTHYDIACDLLDHGKHVLVEKPFCETVVNGYELVKKAESEDLVLAVGHIERHNPVVKFVKDGITSGKFGDLITMTSKRVSNFPGRIRDVGVIFDFGVHDIDVMHHLVGDIKSVYARAGRFTKDIDHEDYANIMLNFENGITGVVEVNWLTPMKIRRLSLTCSESFVEADYIDQSVTISSSSFKNIDEANLYNIPIQHNVNHVSIVKKEPLRNEIEDFIKAISENKRPLANGRDGLMALKTAEAATKSYQTGKEVEIL